MRLPHSLHWRIAIAYTALIFLTMGTVSVYLVDFVSDNFQADLESRLVQEALLISDKSAQFFNPLDTDALQQISNRTGTIINGRVTIFNGNGVAVADTPGELRQAQPISPEVRDAINTGRGHDIRLGGTANENTLFIAIPILDNGTPVGVARIGVPMSIVQSKINQIFLTIFLSAVVVGVLSVSLGYLIAVRSSRSVYSVTEGARLLSEGDLDHRVRALSSDETRDLADAFNSMAATIKDNLADLSDQRNKLAVILETMADGVIVIDEDGQVSRINRSAEWFLDVKVNETYGGRISEVVRDHELQQLVTNAMESGAPQFAEVELHFQRRYLSAIATPLAAEGADSVLLTLHDLTRIRQVETTRKEFVTNVSHELRSPLTSIKAMVETLQDGALDDKTAAVDFLRRIHRDVDRMSGMVNDLLELASLESGQTPIHLSPVDMGPLLEEVVSDCQTSANQHNVAVEVSLPTNMPLVTAEEEKVHQVVTNLIENALKFTPENGRITISANVGVREIKFTVSDTGPGIDSEHLPHVFERFYKVDRARRDGGSGLGLAIVKHIVQSHDGDVSVESTIGEGSAFSFTLPRAN